MHNVMLFLTYNSYKKGIIAMEKIGFRLNIEKKESENKTIRFPLPLIKEIEKTLEGTPSLTLLEKRNFINADKIWLFL